MTATSGSTHGQVVRLWSFIFPVAEIVVTIILKPGGLYLSFAIGLAVALMAVAFSLAGLDKNLLRNLRGACARCMGYHHGTLLFGASILAILALAAFPAKGAGNPAIPYVEYAVGGVLIAEMIYHGYQHRVRGRPRNHRFSYLTGLLAAYVAVFLIMLGFVMQF